MDFKIDRDFNVIRKGLSRRLETAGSGYAR